VVKVKTKTKALIGLLILSNLLIPSLIYVYASNGGTYTISGGIYPNAPDFTISIEDGSFCAKDKYGAFPSWGKGTNATTVIQNALTNGKSVFVKDGIYELSGQQTVFETTEKRYGNLIIDSNTVFWGEQQTILKIANTNQPYSILVNKHPDTWDSNITVRNIMFDANNNQVMESGGMVYSGFCLDFVHVRNSIIENTYTTKATYDGLKLEFIEECIIQGNYAFNNGHCGISIDDWAVKNHVSNNIVDQNGWDGILIDSNALQNTIVQNIAKENGGDGIELRDLAHGNSVIGNIAIDNSDSGIYVEQSNYVTISGNIVEWNDDKGIGLKQSNFTSVSGNTVRNNDQDNNGDSGIVIEDCFNSTFTANIAVDTQGTPTQDYGIFESVNSNYNIVIGNVAYGNVDGQVYTQGANTIENHNQGGTTT